MNVRTMRLILWLATAACVAAGTLGVCLAALLPLEQPETSEARRTNQLAAMTEPDSAAPLSAFAAVWDRDLRPPLYDAPVDSPPPPAAPGVVVPAMPAVHLAGTVFEPGHSLALFRVDAGKTEFKSVGDEIAGMKLLEVRDDGVVVKWNGENRRIPIEPTSPAAAPVRPGPAPGEERP